MTQKERYEKNKESEKEKMKKYYKEHKKEMNEQMKEWRKNHPEKVQEYTERHREYHKVKAKAAYQKLKEDLEKYEAYLAKQRQKYWDKKGGKKNGNNLSDGKEV